MNGTIAEDVIPAGSGARIGGYISTVVGCLARNGRARTPLGGYARQYGHSVTKGMVRVLLPPLTSPRSRSARGHGGPFMTPSCRPRRSAPFLRSRPPAATSRSPIRLAPPYTPPASPRRPSKPPRPSTRPHPRRHHGNHYGPARRRHRRWARHRRRQSRDADIHAHLASAGHRVAVPDPRRCIAAGSATTSRS